MIVPYLTIIFTKSIRVFMIVIKVSFSFASVSVWGDKAKLVKDFKQLRKKPFCKLCKNFKHKKMTCSLKRKCCAGLAKTTPIYASLYTAPAKYRRIYLKTSQFGSSLQLFVFQVYIMEGKVYQFRFPYTMRWSDLGEFKLLPAEQIEAAFYSLCLLFSVNYLVDQSGSVWGR